MLRSFRDPAGFVFSNGGRIFRQVAAEAAADARAFLGSAVHRRMVEERLLQRSWIAGTPAPEGPLLLEHDPVPFPNYPSEWAPEMLRAAARLNLDLAARALEAGFELKDATPHNVMFVGAAPLFLDLLSFARPARPESVWRPYAQFVRTFLYPLLAWRHCGIRLDEVFSVNRDGLDTPRMRRMTPAWRLCLPPFLELVTIPSLASGGAEPESYRERPAQDRAEAAYVQGAVLRRLSKLIEPLCPAATDGASRYMDSHCPYDPQAFESKREAIAAVLRQHRPAWVLDVGCNTGAFSVLAATHGCRVVAIDRDPGAVGTLWRTASAQSLDILPLVVDLANPTPALGWTNEESAPFLQRAKGRFGCVLLSGLLHHLLVTDRIPLGRVLELAAGITTDLAVIEFVSPEDSQFRAIARGRERLHRGLTPEAFQAAAEEWFDIESTHRITLTRLLFVLRRRSG